MKIIQTSQTTFELQSDNGCTTFAGFAIETMGSVGVCFMRTDCPLEKGVVLELFMADQRVKNAIQQRKTYVYQKMREREQNAMALVLAVCIPALIGCLLFAGIMRLFRGPDPIAPVSICERCGQVITAEDHGHCPSDAGLFVSIPAQFLEVPHE